MIPLVIISLHMIRSYRHLYVIRMHGVFGITI